MNRILEILQEKNMTVSDLSSATGANITDDIYDILPSDLAKVSRYMDISADYLLGLTDNREIDTSPVIIKTAEQAEIMIELLKETNKAP